MSRGRFGGLRFQKRIRVLSGVHLNLSLSGIGVSAGGRGFHVGMTARSQKYVSAGIQETGLSVRQYSPMSTPQRDSTPGMNFVPVVIAIVILAVLVAVASMR
jgi:hypothetical protein